MCDESDTIQPVASHAPELVAAKVQKMLRRLRIPDADQSVARRDQDAVTALDPGRLHRDLPKRTVRRAASENHAGRAARQVQGNDLVLGRHEEDASSRRSPPL